MGKLKTVVITIQVPMDSEQSKEWLRSSDYFNESVNQALNTIADKPIKKRKGSIKTDSENANFLINVINE